MRLTTFSIDVYDGIGPNEEVNGHPAPAILPHEFEGYSADERWNGWACPYFTFDQAMRVVQQHNALYRQSQEHREDRRFPHLGGEAWYDEQADEFCFPADGGELYRFGSAWRDGLKLYAIGTYEWTWSQKGDWDEERVVPHLAVS